jgi:hypothetical protein
MKKIFYNLLLIPFLFGCLNEDYVPNEIKNNPIDELVIDGSVGIKLFTKFVCDDVTMNIKIKNSDSITIKIFDFSNKIVSKECIDAKSGDNILKVYTKSLPTSSYRIGIFDSKDNMLDITDFNKL